MGLSLSNVAGPNASTKHQAPTMRRRFWGRNLRTASDPISVMCGARGSIRRSPHVFVLVLVLPAFRIPLALGHGQRFLDALRDLFVVRVRELAQQLRRL